MVLGTEGGVVVIDTGAFHGSSCVQLMSCACTDRMNTHLRRPATITRGNDYEDDTQAAATLRHQRMVSGFLVSVLDRSRSSEYNKKT
jgi:hypothetical protein